MTYQQHFEKLREEYQNSSDHYLKLDKQLFETNGFGDFGDIPNYAEAYQNWQTATNNYWNFLSLVKGRTFKPNDEFALN